MQLAPQSSAWPTSAQGHAPPVAQPLPQAEHPPGPVRSSRRKLVGRRKVIEPESLGLDSLITGSSSAPVGSENQTPHPQRGELPRGQSSIPVRRSGSQLAEAPYRSQCGQTGNRLPQPTTASRRNRRHSDRSLSPAERTEDFRARSCGRSSRLFHSITCLTKRPRRPSLRALDRPGGEASGRQGHACGRIRQAAGWER